MKTKTSFIILLMVIFTGTGAFAQHSDTFNTAPPAQPKEQKKNWYENLQIRGYSQVRYNRLFETNENLKCEQCDRSWGKGGGVFIRRARIILFGNVHERVYIYIQPDFASSASSTGLHFGQLRDAYFDLSLDGKKEFRLRFGQSKIPYGFENLQSSQNRIPLDRADPTNSAVSNERDLGVFFYWAPKKIRERFSELVSSGLKGSGDYGVFAFGVYNGQTANKPELNNSLHMVSRISYPIQIRNQIIEPGIQAYTGKFVIAPDQLSNISKGKTKVNQNSEYLDQRAAASFVLYPKPFGIQAEYNTGVGPRFNKLTDSIEQSPLQGGYVLMSYMINVGKQLIIPFARYQYYNGGKKHETDARAYFMNEQEIGIEWQPIKNFELVAMYTISHRQFEDLQKEDNRQLGSLLRLQAQFNY